MIKFDQYKLDRDAITSGVWRTTKIGLRVKVASIRSPLYKTAIMRLKRHRAEDLRLNDPEIIKEITCKAMAEAILLDWQGADIEYSKESAFDTLMEYEVFREEISELAATDDNYKPDDISKK